MLTFPVNQQESGENTPPRAIHRLPPTFSGSVSRENSRDSGRWGMIYFLSKWMVSVTEKRPVQGYWQGAVKKYFCIWSSQLLSRTVVKRESILRSTREEEKSLSPEYLGTSTPGREVVEPKDPTNQSHSTTSASKSTVITCRPSE